MTTITSERKEAEAAIRKALAGCSGCEYDEAEGGLLNHCNRCCRKITGLAWNWAHADRRLRVVKTATPTGGV